MPLPQDPVLLMSLINTYLRDEYSSFEALCEDKNIDAGQVTAKLEAAGFAYQAGQNQFR